MRKLSLGKKLALGFVGLVTVMTVARMSGLKSPRDMAPPTPPPEVEAVASPEPAPDRKESALYQLAHSNETGAPTEVRALIRRGEELNGRCRGGSGDEPATMAACEARDQLYAEIGRAGWCYGSPDQIMADRTWQPCSAGKAQPPVPQAGDAINYDRDRARMAMIGKTVLRDTQWCVDRGVRSFLYAGERNRERLAEKMGELCSKGLIANRIMDSAEEAVAWTRVLAYDAIKQVEREGR